MWSPHNKNSDSCAGASKWSLVACGAWLPGGVSMASDAIIWGNFVALWIVVIALSFLVIGIARRTPVRRPNANSGFLLPQESTIPDFTVETATGEPFTQAQLLGSSALLFFASSHCVPCLLKLDEFKHEAPLISKLGLKCFVIDTDGAGASSILSDKAPPTAHILAAPRITNSMMADYRVPGTPAYVLVSPEGRVLDSGLMDRPFASFLQRWRDLLRSAPPSSTLMPSQGG